MLLCHACFDNAASVVLRGPLNAQLEVNIQHENPMGKYISVNKQNSNTFTPKVFSSSEPLELLQ